MEPSHSSRGNPCQKDSSLVASSVNTTQQLSDTTELIKVYRCLVYKWVTGPHDKCMEITVPINLARLRACTLPFLAERSTLADTINVSQWAAGT